MKNICFSLVLTLFFFKAFCQAPNDSTIIRLTYKQAKPDDQFILCYSGEQRLAFDDRILDADTIKVVKLANNRYEFVFSAQKSFLKNYGYVQIFLLRKPADQLKAGALSDARYTIEVLPLMLSAKGDRVDINLVESPRFLPGHSYLRNFKLGITGIGSAKYSIHRQLDSIWYNTPFGKTVSKEHRYIDTNYVSRTIRKSLQLLSDKCNELEPIVLQMLRTYAVYGNRTQEAVLMDHFYKKDFVNWTKQEKSDLIKNVDSAFDPEKFHLAAYTLIWSKEYIDALIAEAGLIASISCADPRPDSIYYYLKKSLRGELRDKAITQYLVHYGMKLEDPDKILKDAYNLVQSPCFKPFIKNLYARTNGQLAYNFALPDAKGKAVSLSDYKGKIVLIDFWYTGCSSCIDFYTKELSKAEKYYEQDPDVVFITISIDKSKSTWLSSIVSGKYTGANAVNLYTSGLGMASDVTKYYRVGSFPQPMLIDKQQRIRGFNMSLRSEAGIKDGIEKLR